MSKLSRFEEHVRSVVGGLQQGLPEKLRMLASSLPDLALSDADVFYRDWLSKRAAIILFPAIMKELAVRLGEAIKKNKITWGLAAYGIFQEVIFFADLCLDKTLFFELAKITGFKLTSKHPHVRCAALHALSLLPNHLLNQVQLAGLPGMIENVFQGRSDSREHALRDLERLIQKIPCQGALIVVMLIALVDKLMKLSDSPGAEVSEAALRGLIIVVPKIFKQELLLKLAALAINKAEGAGALTALRLLHQLIPVLSCDNTAAVSNAIIELVKSKLHGTSESVCIMALQVLAALVPQLSQDEKKLARLRGMVCDWDAGSACEVVVASLLVLSAIAKVMKSETQLFLIRCSISSFVSSPHFAVRKGVAKLQVLLPESTSPKNKANALGFLSPAERHVFVHQAKEDASLLDGLMGMLMDKDSAVRDEAKHSLGALSQEQQKKLLLTMVSLLMEGEGGDYSTASQAATVLLTHVELLDPTLVENLIHVVFAGLKDTDRKTQHAALSTLIKLAPRLQEQDSLAALVYRVGEKINDQVAYVGVHGAALSALGVLIPQLSDQAVITQVFKRISGALCEQEAPIGLGAYRVLAALVPALQDQAAISDAVFSAVIEQLDNEHKAIREAAGELLLLMIEKTNQQPRDLTFVRSGLLAKQSVESALVSLSFLNGAVSTGQPAESPVARP